MEGRRRLGEPAPGEQENATNKGSGVDRPVCQVCGAEAIGIQSLGCCAVTVCFEHAEPSLRNAQPGGTVSWGDCAFFRFEHATRR